MSQDPISVVIIGINVDGYLVDCIQSVRETDYPQDRLEIIYVDGGSKDQSVTTAKTFHNVRVIELDHPKPTPGRGRNAGWRAAKYDVIQFLDADTTIDRNWLKRALPHLKDSVVAVCGRREELHRDKNPYHLIGDIEWDASPGLIDAFGGDVLVKKKALEAVDGYDEELIGGEDPDLSYRLRQEGGLLLRINEAMTTHDLNMDSFQQYCRRAFRTGHAYAEIGLRYRKMPEKFWLRELTRISSSTTLPWILLSAASYVGLPFVGLMLAGSLSLRPLRLIKEFERKFHLNRAQSIFYALHLSFVVYPQMAGVLRYLCSWLSPRKQVSS